MGAHVLTEVWGHVLEVWLHPPWLQDPVVTEHLEVPWVVLKVCLQSRGKQPKRHPLTLASFYGVQPVRLLTHPVWQTAARLGYGKTYRDGNKTKGIAEEEAEKLIVDWRHKNVRR